MRRAPCRRGGRHPARLERWGWAGTARCLPEPARRELLPGALRRPRYVLVRLHAARDRRFVARPREPMARRSTPGRAAPVFRRARPRACACAPPSAPIAFDRPRAGRGCRASSARSATSSCARADGQFAYQLAVVVDDAEQGVTDVVRGADLLDSTPRQIYLQRLLGHATPRYLHVPAAVNAAGEKLSKQTGARRWHARVGAIPAASARVPRPARTAMTSRGGGELGSLRASQRAGSRLLTVSGRERRPAQSAAYSVQRRPLAEEQHAAQHADHRDDQHADRETLTGTEVAILIHAQWAKAKAMSTL